LLDEHRSKAAKLVHFGLQVVRPDRATEADQVRRRVRSV
jgi:hypothetical protein